MNKVKQQEIGELKKCKKVFCIVYTKEAFNQYKFMGTTIFGANKMVDITEQGIDIEEAVILDTLKIGEMYELSDLGFGLPCIRIK